MNRRLILTLFLGFSSGLPLLATGSTLQYWLTEQGASLALIGLLAAVRKPYSLKFLWAPVMDRYVPLKIGRRKGWMILTQFCVAVTLCILGFVGSAAQAGPLFIAALMVCFFSASQDIVLDAHRRDTLYDKELGLGSSLFITGYRIGMVVAGAGAVWLSQYLSWSSVYFVLAGCMGIGLVATYFADEPDLITSPPTLQAAVTEPFKDFFKRQHAILILAFMVLYKIGDSLGATLNTPFFIQLGFSKDEYVAVYKLFGMLAVFGGALLGGSLMLRLTINRALWIFGIAQAVSTLGFAYLASVGHSLTALSAVVGFENLTSGMGTAAFTAYMARLCNRDFSAAQYALFTSLAALPGIWLSSVSGVLVEHIGWSWFYIGCAAMALPGLALLCIVAPYNAINSES